MKNSLFGLCLSLQFLTRIPVPVECPWNKETSRWALRCYPLTGMLLGGILVLTVSLLHGILPTWMLALLILTIWIWITGGLHLDGWMDVADAIGSNATLEKKWEIMKDPMVGSFGILSLLFLIVWKAVFIYLLLNESFQYIICFLVILACSRGIAVCLMYLLPTAQQQGLAFEWKKNLTRGDVVVAFLPIAALFLLLPEYLVLLLGYFFFTWLYGHWMMKHFKGSNGDLLGTAIEGGELCGLIVMWIYISFVIG
ncbi:MULTISPECIES: adenosylcobinamide-GDP ribazoletransferase [Bacillaceae]|uniref:Adenosylcobinamide-GDP ribazoletransferase n=1 Tax=Sutcliffiella horikoshii TaxID=79883 RepID=A0A5D4TEE6_9BACI|nr:MULTISPECIES: adenosylcobinamide-GDP ribazoletransferase [Bacillaceae]TYS73128.1 adenosylcobinamide-GDP ribazoletransferase [Sutcliffiella horikoshii]